MVMGLVACSSCGEPWDCDGQKRTECFRCHVRGIRLGFTHTKADFHGPTIRERAKAQEAEMTAKGVSFANVGSRWV